MRKNFGSKPWLYPQPVTIIATYDADGNVDAMNAAWAGTGSMDTVVLDLTHTHKTVENLQKAGAFTVSIADAANVVPADYVGIVSANKEASKMQKAGWTATKSEFVNAPVIDQLPLCLECEFTGFDEAGHTVGKVVNVSCDEKALGADGNPDFAKLDAIIYEPINHGYYRLGQRVGTAFSDGAQLK